MTEAFDSPRVLTLKYLFGLAGTLGCSYVIIRILFNIELNQFKRSVAPEVEKNLSELTLSSTNSDDENENETDQNYNGNGNGNGNSNQSIINPTLSKDRDSSLKSIQKSKSEDTYARKKRIHKETKFGIYFNVALLTFVNYLLMVYLPSGIAPSLIAMILLTAILLRTQLIEDLRRKRLDRISSIFTLLIFMAAFLSLVTYATIGKKEGGVYEGKARIVGYDITTYNDGAKGGNDYSNAQQSSSSSSSSSSGSGSGAVRTDLEVEWGGEWGCPDTPAKQCHAYVSGALCEAKSDSTGAGGRKNMNRNRKSRQLKKDKKIQAADDTKAYYKELVDEETEYAQDLKQEVDETAEDEDLVYVEELQNAEEFVTYYANQTEKDIDAMEQGVQTVEDTVDGDLANVKETVMEGDDPDGTMAAGVINEATSDVQALEDQIAELEKEVEVLEETNSEEEELNQIDQSNAEYYAGQAIDAIDTAVDLADENAVLQEDETYYAAVANEEAEENNGLQNANADLVEETTELENEVDEVVKYYQKKEADAPIIEDVITITYYPVNATNATGEYYVYTTETQETVPNTNANANNAYGSGYDDDFAYSFEDDYFEDEYWGYDWDSAWGDYACNDLFDTDLSNESYDENEAPGNDVFPYVNIYGTCNSCKAFLVDYYSTAHFDKIREYQTHAWTYAGFGVLSIFMTAALMVKQHVSPAQENQIDLLMSEGGGYERQLV